MDRTLTRILEWHNSWENKLKTYLENEDYSKIIDIHFKGGAMLLSTMAKFLKTHPDSISQLKEKINLLRDKLILIQDARKSIDTLK